jgi:ribose 5-phosphate isomerase A
MQLPESLEAEKRLAAESAAAVVEDGMRVGLGSGSTVAFLLTALGARRLDIVCVATSAATETTGRAHGLRIEPFDRLDRLDIAIDGADQVATDFWLVKGGGGAHTREKIVAAAADRFVVIVSHDKLVQVVGGPVPMELLGFGLEATLKALGAMGDCQLRGVPPSPDGGVIADLDGELGDPAAMSARLSGTPGVIGHGLFPPELVHEVVVARAGGVEHLIRR